MRKVAGLLLMASVASALSKGGTGYNFLRVPAGFAPSVFYAAGVGGSEYLGATFLNPALLASSKAVSMSYGSYVADIKFGSTLVGLSRDATVGLFYLNSGSMTETDEEGNVLGTFSSHHLGAFFRKALEVAPEVTAGWCVKFLYQGAAGYSSMALAADLGVWLFSPEGSYGAGASLRNLGYEVKSFIEERAVLPMEFLVGGVYRFPSIDLAAGMGFSLDYPFFLSLGMSYRLSSFLSVAAGYNSRGRDLSTGGQRDILNGFSGGVSITVGERALLGYSYTPYGDLGDVHRVEVQLNLR